MSDFSLEKVKVNKWVELDLPVPFKDEIERVIGLVKTSLEAVKVILETIQTFLEILRTLIILVVNPAVAALLTALYALRDVLRGIIDMGCGYTYVLPDLSNPYSVQEAMALLAQSFGDRLDDNRPIRSTDTNEAIVLITFVAYGPSLTIIKDLWDLLKQLIKLPDFPLTDKKANQGDNMIYPAPGAGEGEYPNWTTARFIDLFPGFKGTLQFTLGLIDSLIDIFELQIAFIMDIFNAILIKIAVLESIINRIDSIIAALNMALNLKVPMSIIIGEFNAVNLGAEISNASSNVPNLPEDNTGALLSMAVTGPALDTFFKTAFNVSLADIFGVSYDSIKV
tara:strand:- start:23 stop:1036 length:1014 start_codon:yes stop_codon:yes gene_type:complete